MLHVIIYTRIVITVSEKNHFLYIMCLVHLYFIIMHLAFTSLVLFFKYFQKYASLFHPEMPDSTRILPKDKEIPQCHLPGKILTTTHVLLHNLINVDQISAGSSL